ncbi:hypothetical protein [Flavilitoribacter nigricans]|uniref:DUF4292 domain-containing protein n=1 Tax=Flavilitoribacter nigricans (strain ATCC 23147 / DSM 23189 / NBRC 102662 / NCIMB 1420 / SS-2) TaxID=1122177 RepID=A0A2D0MZT5_FLAN2|nr:hypothetical protein [Flavilitoribacter nigricans]PHN01636.1 hypothetical protein CRP01_36060 [Flavilitoribacter nigricans DSM 23189 = NBRC 102662]
MKMYYACLSLLALPFFLACQPAVDLPDGTFSETELRRYQSLGTNGANEVLTEANDDYLKIGVKSGALYVANICLCNGDEMIILHASAALGKMTYQKTAEGKWPTPTEKFDFGMRETGLDKATIAKRKGYLQENGWIANTMEMGNPGETEFMISKELLRELGDEISIAVSLMPASDPDRIIDFPQGKAPGCAAKSLVGGYLEAAYDFQPGQWYTVPPTSGR